MTADEDLVLLLMQSSNIDIDFLWTTRGWWQHPHKTLLISFKDDDDEDDNELLLLLLLLFVFIDDEGCVSTGGMKEPPVDGSKG